VPGVSLENNRRLQKKASPTASNALSADFSRWTSCRSTTVFTLPDPAIFCFLPFFFLPVYYELYPPKWVDEFAAILKQLRARCSAPDFSLGNPQNGEQEPLK
jgi:hypothetical protein